jgi:hypothetical protein
LVDAEDAARERDRDVVGQSVGEGRGVVAEAERAADQVDVAGPRQAARAVEEDLGRFGTPAAARPPG